MSDGDVDRVPWDVFFPRFRWRQGEHVSIIGPTGQGKSTLALALVERRKWVAALVTKPKDRTFSGLRKHGWTLARQWPPPPMAHRVLLWPPMRKAADERRQAEVFDAALNDMFTAGAWCVLADEMRYLCGRLGLTSHFELLWLQGRSIGVSLVTLTQRPAHVPLEMYDQATHLFFFRDSDEANLKRIGGIGWRSSRLIREHVSQLADHDVLYVNAASGDLIVTRYDP